MATEYRLSFTASEINERLGMVDNLVKTVNGVAPDEIGNVEIEVDNQPDWNQNDFSANDYIKNRPFYEQSGDVLFDSDINIMFNPMGAGESMAGISISKALTVGSKYFVTIDGETLECICEQSTATISHLRNLQFSFGTISIANRTDNSYTDVIASINMQNKLCHLRITGEDTVKKIDPKYLPDEVLKPYVIDSEAYTYGDDALAAILEGRQILVKVSNKNGNTIFSNFMPVLQYQLPNNNNNYLILFYLKDGIAENIMTAMQTGSFDGVYGVIEMMLSQSYAECPLKVSPIK